ncbi:hypothetical protein trd_0698 [Thermomicrobium roseum DSM 5159]|uniref:Uncharacterized protein n=1 Tax=Thermomicrobium roseum (strain ATCC 27502 / DSM 5159 / P-2) TaxID=309801 RepID=B9KYY9_THERP|nr:hypothetical protein trd_0698 [Thermomicrobium roseum DSM 5159]
MTDFLIRAVSGRPILVARFFSDLIRAGFRYALVGRDGDARRTNR